jgi:hypothetical protein
MGGGIGMGVHRLSVVFVLFHCIHTVVILPYTVVILPYTVVISQLYGIYSWWCNKADLLQ